MPSRTVSGAGESSSRCPCRRLTKTSPLASGAGDDDMGEAWRFLFELCEISSESSRRPLSPESSPGVEALIIICIDCVASMFSTASKRDSRRPI